MDIQSVYGEPNGCTNKSSAQRRGHNRARECATPFGRRKVYMDSDEDVEHQRMNERIGWECV